MSENRGADQYSINEFKETLDSFLQSMENNARKHELYCEIMLKFAKAIEDADLYITLNTTITNHKDRCNILEKFDADLEVIRSEIHQKCFVEFHYLR